MQITYFITRTVSFVFSLKGTPSTVAVMLQTCMPKKKVLHLGYVVLYVSTLVMLFSMSSPWLCCSLCCTSMYQKRRCFSLSTVAVMYVAHLCQQKTGFSLGTTEPDWKTGNPEDTLLHPTSRSTTNGGLIIREKRSISRF